MKEYINYGILILASDSLGRGEPLIEETPVRTRVLVKKIPYPKRMRYLFLLLYAEDSEKLHNPLSKADEKLLEKVNRIWHNRSR